MPAPRAHLTATLSLLDGLAPPGNPSWSAWRAFLDQPDALPRRVRPEDSSLKFDTYVADGPTGPRWGFTVADRYEGPGFWVRARSLLRSLPGYDASFAETVVADSRGWRPSLVLGAGFDHPENPPRIKLYLQEPTWGGGGLRARDARDAVLRWVPGVHWPDWIPDDRLVGVVCIELHPDGARGCKLYLGGATTLAAASGAPSAAVDLAERMSAASGMAGGHAYLTVRLRAGVDAGYAINHIYDHVAIGFTRQGARLPEAWSDVEALFESAGRSEAFIRLRTRVQRPDWIAVPTATALEDAGRSADAYVGVWAR